MYALFYPVGNLSHSVGPTRSYCGPYLRAKVVLALVFKVLDHGLQNGWMISWLALSVDVASF